MTIENEDDIFEVRMYEVIDEELNKYSSTQVSGGVNGAAINSTTTHYSNQRLWLRDLDTGIETQIQHDSYNVAARPGHTLVYGFNKVNDRFERIVNLDTGVISKCGGTIPDWNGEESGIPGRIAMFIMLLIMSPIMFIPLLGPICTLLIDLKINSKLEFYDKAAESKQVSYLLCLISLSLCLAIYTVGYGMWVDEYRSSYSHILWPTIAASVLRLFIWDRIQKINFIDMQARTKYFKCFFDRNLETFKQRYLSGKNETTEAQGA